MATLYFAVWESAGEVAQGPVLQEGTVEIGGTSAQSAAIAGSGRARRRVRVFADTACLVTWGANPTAKTDGSDGRPLGAENPEYFEVEAGQKLAVVQRVLP